MKWITSRNAFALVLLAMVAVGCNKNALKDAGNAEKDKEQGAIDNRANAINNVGGSATSN